MATTRRTIVGLVGLVALLGAALTAQVALAQGGEEGGGASDDELLERLAGLEGTLPGLQPTAVEIAPDETWGAIDGDFGGGAATIETVGAELASLFADADDTDTAVGHAVSSAARGWLDLGEGYDALGEWEGHDLAFPLDTFDDQGVATGADEVRGDAERGLRHVLAAHERLLAGYTTLRAEGLADGEAQAAFDARAAETEDFDTELRPLVHRLLSLPTTMVLRPVDRFQTDAPGDEARALSFTVVCIDREAYADMQGVATGDVPGAEELDARDDETAERVDCPELPEGLEAGPLQPVDDG